MRSRPSTSQVRPFATSELRSTKRNEFVLLTSSARNFRGLVRSCSRSVSPSSRSRRYEADDVIGTLAQKGEAAGLDVIILTGDLDVLQLVTEHIRVFASRRGISDTIIYDVAKVRERYGFEPPLVVDFKALQGDPSDNIPGVPGIGEKTAMSLVQQYGPLENVLAAVPTMPPGRVQRALESHMEQARLSKWTATIKVDLDIDLPLEDARLFHYDEAEVRELFDRLEFRSLLPRLPGRAVDEDVAPAAPGATPDAPPGELQIPATDVEIIIDSRQADDAVERVRNAGAMSIRTVVDGNPRTGVSHRRRVRAER